MHISIVGNRIALAAMMLALFMGAVLFAGIPAFAQTTTTPPADTTTTGGDDATTDSTTQQATTPSLPSAGEGGNASMTLALLAATGIVGAAGSAYLLRKAMR